MRASPGSVPGTLSHLASLAVTEMRGGLSRTLSPLSWDPVVTPADGAAPASTCPISLSLIRRLLNNVAAKETCI